MASMNQNLQAALSHSVFSIVSKSAKEIGVSCYVVGGFVRDYLLERGSATDLDFVTEGSGIELAKQVAKNLNQKQISIFKRFGTAMVNHKGLELEFVGARKESYSEDSRKPFVEIGTLSDDQKRRDFSINAMAISLNEATYGELLDPFFGVEDLAKKRIVTPLDPVVTYSDDPLRMMRAIRFAAQLGFDIEAKSFAAIQSQVERIDIVSKERIMKEFNKIMDCPKPSVGLLLLEESGLMERILPELTALKGIDEVDGKSHKDNFYHSLEVVDNIAEETTDLWLRWAALLHDIGKASTKRKHPVNGWSFHSHEFVGAKMVKKVFRRLKMPLGAPLKFVEKIVNLSSRPIALVGDEVSDSALRRMLFDAGSDLDSLLILCKADITTKNVQKKNKYKKNFIVVEQKLKSVEERDQIKNFQPPVSGAQIMEALSLKPGREVGLLKNKIKEAILEGEIPNEEKAAFRYLLLQADKMGLKK